GRTARAGRAGKAYSFVSKEESGDFGRILRLTKAPILPMRPEDKLHAFVPGTSVHSNGGGGYGGRGYRGQGGRSQHGYRRYR
ncbi:MAG TPA: ATP-dependent helicase, partial [Nitrososphaerales archaeon]|nr:ATP-dependent helicase [Nitrososphaerales archaeon]